MEDPNTAETARELAEAIHDEVRQEIADTERDQGPVDVFADTDEEVARTTPEIVIHNTPGHTVIVPQETVDAVIETIDQQGFTVVDTGTSLATIAANENLPVLANSLDMMYDVLEKAAANNVQAAIDDAGEENFSPIEQRALLRAEMLNLSKGLDFAAIMIRGRLFDEIEQEGLVAAHPGGFGNIQEFAVDQGISTSEMSQTLDMYRIIFPWVEETLEVTAMRVFEQVGKSNMRELVPILKRFITGEDADAASVNTAHDRLIEDHVATLLAAGQARPGDDTIRADIVRMLLEDGAQLTNAEVRRRVRPDRTVSINANIITVGGRTVIIAEVDDTQEQLVARRLHGYWDPFNFALEEGTRVRPTPQFRSLLRSLLEGFDLDNGE